MKNHNHIVQLNSTQQTFSALTIGNLDQKDLSYSSNIISAGLKALGLTGKRSPQYAEYGSKVLQKIYTMYRLRSQSGAGTVYNNEVYFFLTWREAQAFFPALSKATINRVFNFLTRCNLLKKEFLQRGNLRISNNSAFYAINFSRVEEVIKAGRRWLKALNLPNSQQREDTSQHREDNSHCREIYQDTFNTLSRKTPPTPPRGKEKSYACNSFNYNSSDSNNNTFVPLSNKLTKLNDTEKNQKEDQFSGRRSINTDLSTTTDKLTTKPITKNRWDITQHPCWDVEADDFNEDFLNFVVDTTSRWTMANGDRIIGENLARSAMISNLSKLKQFWKSYQKQAKKRLKNAATRVSHGCEIKQEEQPKLEVAMQAIGSEETMAIAKQFQQPLQIEDSEAKEAARKKVTEAKARQEKIKQQQEEAQAAQKRLQEQTQKQQEELEQELAKKRSEQRKKLEEEAIKALADLPESPQEKIKHWLEKLRSPMPSTVAAAVEQLRLLGCKVVSINGTLDLEF